MTAHIPSGPVLVGVVEGQRPEVLRTAVRFATDLRAPLLLVTVAPDPYLVGEYVDPMTGAIPIAVAPTGNTDERTVPPALSAAVEEALAGSDVPWTLRVTQGEPALALTDIADETDARMIVVGTRDPGLLATIAEFLSGSVAAHLAHRQHRPVLVVPRTERDPSRPAPWDLAE